MNDSLAVVGLSQAGNLGDDLIFVAVLNAINSVTPGARVHFLDFGSALDWTEIRRSVAIDLELVSERVGRDFPGTNRLTALLADASRIVFGGGGLLQTTHHPLRPYQWLTHLGPMSLSRPSLAVGLGLGPLGYGWKRRLKKMGSPFSKLFVRDMASLRLARDELEWDAKRCGDFVDADFLSSIGIHGQVSKDGSLGVALRAWPGLSANSMSDHILRIAYAEQSTAIRFFVLESKYGEGPDVDFTKEVRLALPSNMRGPISTYGGGNPIAFSRDLVCCSSAISMKLHSSILWGAAGSAIYPISYASKTSALFGQPYRGLQVWARPLLVAREDRRTPRAHDLIVSWLSTQSGAAPDVAPRHGPFSAGERVAYQILSLSVDSLRRVTRSIPTTSRRG